MRDLNRIDIDDDKNQHKESIKKETESDKKTKKKNKLLFVGIAILLVIGGASKIINKHIKKKKAEEKQKQELVNQNQDEPDNINLNAEKPKIEKKDNPNKMTFTFYDNLKHESVTVDAVPAKQRAQYVYTYVYQIASFRSRPEAQRYVESLERVGLKPKFQKAGSWIRMYIGPYHTKRSIAPDIIKLQRLGINDGFIREVDRQKVEPKKS